MLKHIRFNTLGRQWGEIRLRVPDRSIFAGNRGQGILS